MEDEIIINDEELLSYYEFDSYKSYIKEISKYKLLSNDEIVKLFYAGDYNKIIESNLRLVVWVARNYIYRVNHMQFLDLIQEGNIGLMNAIEHFDPSRGAFSSCAVLWIRQALQRSISIKEDTIRKPDYIRVLYNRYLKLINDASKNNITLSDDEIKDKLDISDNIYLELVDMKKFNTTSLNVTVGDDEDTELEDFVPSNNNSFDDVVVNQEDQIVLLSIIKHFLSPREYFIIYNRVIVDNAVTLEQLGDILNITRERVRQIESKALNKLKRLNYKEPRIYKTLLNNINNYKNGNDYNVYPISPNDITFYMFIKKFLEPIELKIIYNELLSDIVLGKNHICSMFNITGEYYDKVYDDLIVKKNYLINSLEYKKYHDSIIKIYGSSIYNELKEDNIKPIKFIDYAYLRIKYFDYSFVELRKLFLDNGIVLSRKNQKVLSNLFSYHYYNGSSLHEIERDINILKLGYNKKYSCLPKKILYKTYMNNIDNFSEYERSIANTFIFKIKKDNIKYKRDRIIYIIDKIERIYYDISNLPVIDKEKYLLMKDTYPNKYNSKRIQVMDMYYGVNGKKMSVSTIADTLNESRDIIRDVLRNGILTTISLFMERTNTISIDKKLYIPFLKDNYCDFNILTYEILSYYLIDDLSNDEISKKVNMNNYRVSNIITEGLRKIDLYRFRIITKKEIDDNLFNVVIEDPKLDDLQINIVKDRYYTSLSNDDIANKYNMTKSEVVRIIDRFNKIYDTYLIKSITLDKDDYINEYNKHFSESILNDNELKVLKLLHIDNLSTHEIINILNIDINAFYRYKYSIDIKLKQSKKGVRPDLLYISRNELNEVLKDVHLPLSDKEKDIICYLFELNNHPYKSIKELSLMYNENDTSIRRRYQRAIVSIFKYKNKEINGKIDYDNDILPNIKYFSNFERSIIKDIYVDNMSDNKIGIKYNISVDITRTFIKDINYRIYCLINGFDFKKFDYDYYLSVKDNDDLAFYGDIKMAQKIFDLYYGMEGVPLTFSKIVNELNLNCSSTAISRFLSSYVLAIYKHKDGIKRGQSFNVDKVVEYYNNHKDEMGVNHLTYYERYINKYNNKITNSLECHMNKEIIYDLIKEYDDDYIELSSLSKGDVISILNNYDNKLSSSIKKQLKLLYGIEDNKTIHKVYKLLNELDIKITKNSLIQNNNKKVLAKN